MKHEIATTAHTSGFFWICSCGEKGGPFIRALYASRLGAAHRKDEHIRGPKTETAS